jgi:thiosulfate/3-mercaptopyruvate sulfurtransferase
VVESCDQFKNPDAVASPGWLAENLDEPGIVVIDTRYTVEVDDKGRFVSVPGRSGYLKAHIPGAVFLDLDDLKHPDDPTRIINADDFAATMSAVGISSEHEVVVYDTEGGTWAARLWWALRYHGHNAVRILDGGFTSWTSRGFRIESGPRTNEPHRFVPRIVPELRIEIDDVRDAVGEANTVIVDALPEPFFTGQIPLYPHLRRGHIPGAFNIAAPAQVDPVTWELLPPDRLNTMWMSVVGDSDRIITYCGGGVYGAFDIFVLHLLGFEATLYDGSWEEWGARQDTPVETGPARKWSEP